jgi:hypothetical protein
MTPGLPPTFTSRDDRDQTVRVLRHLANRCRAAAANPAFPNEADGFNEGYADGRTAAAEELEATANRIADVLADDELTPGKATHA